ncbi:thiopurine S-methyltransferase [Nitrosomonas aestuarii]|uniref:Thiopurine S-methyltransferase n=1 Tax=Nitrosomonas aestuarii TaxID=52441 RepID=A0A1I3Y6U8_9PROT|nr:thiopurine S-methyltransferase [Nitrosomonas aestuarii]SFK27707.1 thiopurine S-methyltransferase [Nitrosomonas aestuarii]
MTKEYWMDRWKRDETGFHQHVFNPYLVQYWEMLQLTLGSQVFVPLCGKTRDMIWLRNQGHSVLGIELSTLAIKAFFEENGLSANHDSGEKFDYYAADAIQIFHGDFFNLGKCDLKKISAVYDRASLVALPPETRRHYAHHMLHILPPATKILLISFDYPQSEMQGPPFAVSPDEVIALYQNHTEIRLLTEADILNENPRFQQRGLSRLQESIFLLTLHRPNQ